MYRQALNMFAACAAVVVATSATLPLCAAEVAADEAREAVRGWAVATSGFQKRRLKGNLRAAGGGKDLSYASMTTC